MKNPIEVSSLHERIAFENAWARAVNHVMRNRQEIAFGGKIKGKEQFEKKKAYDSDLTIVLEGNALDGALKGVLHPQFPTREKVLAGYLKEWERGYDWKKQGFTYCYENRIEAYLGAIRSHILPNHSIGVKYESFPALMIDQWKLAKEDLEQQIETGIQSNRNVIVIGNPSIDRYEIPDSPPCLREIWIRHEGDRNVSVKWKFRSRDLYAAWMTNVIGILSAVQREVIAPNGCKIIQVVDKNDSLHIYEGDWQAASQVKPIQISPQMRR